MMLKKIGITLLVLFGVLIVAALIFIRSVGLWHVVFPTSRHEIVPPELPVGIVRPAVLVFSKTNGFRHFDGIEGGNRLFESMATQNGWGHFQTENSAVFNEAALNRFDTVIFSNVTGDVLSDEQEAVFQQWLEGGGGWIGVHAAGDKSHEGWSWYVDNLIGARFTAHTMGPQFQTATVHMEKVMHPVTFNVPPVWQHEEEWYSFDRSPREAGFNILATVDESTYQPFMKLFGMEQDLRMGDHPVVWSRCIGEGRALYAAMGHQAAAFEVPAYQQVLKGAIMWTMHEAGPECSAEVGKE